MTPEEVRERRGAPLPAARTPNCARRCVRPVQVVQREEFLLTLPESSTAVDGHAGLQGVLASLQPGMGMLGGHVGGALRLSAQPPPPAPAHTLLLRGLACRRQRGRHAAAGAGPVRCGGGRRARGRGAPQGRRLADRAGRRGSIKQQ